MATIAVGYYPELTVAEVVARLKTHFDGKYVIYNPRGFEAAWHGKPNVIVRKNGWSSVALWLEQTENMTRVRFKLTWPPFALLGLLLAAAISLMLFGAGWGMILIGVALVVTWTLLRRNGRSLEEDIMVFVQESRLRKKRD